jgi:hypothetical protein
VVLRPINVKNSKRELKTSMQFPGELNITIAATNPMF